MPHEDAPVASIAVERAPELPHLHRRRDPARSFRIELTQLLQLQIFFFAQKLRGVLSEAFMADGV